MTIRAEEEAETKLHIAARLNNVKLLRAALREGLDIDALGIGGWTALHQAASCGYLEITIALLENGANPNIQDDQKCTPIHLASRNGHLEVVRSLCRNGARLDLRNAEGRMPQNCGDEECRTFLERQREWKILNTVLLVTEMKQLDLHLDTWLNGSYTEVFVVGLDTSL